MSRIKGNPGMELKASGFEVVTPSGRKSGSSSKPGRVRDQKANPRSRRVNRSTRADAFGAFSDQVLRDLNPRGTLESVIADHVVRSAWKLKGAIDRQDASRPADRENPERPGETPKRTSQTALDRAARSVREALESLDYARDLRASREAAPMLEPASDFSLPEIEPNEWPIVPFEPVEALEVEAGDSDDDVPPIWSGRLIFDFEVSDDSPVVKGTWITVSHVVSLIVDGYSWADILRSHPELSEKDIRVCVAYAVAQDQDDD